MKKIILVLLMTFAFNSKAFAGWTLVSQTTSFVSSSVNGATTNNINSTGATLLLASVGASTDSTALTLTDSNGNTWHSLVNYHDPSSQYHVSVWYAYDHGGSSLVVGSGHSFTVTCSNCNGGPMVSAWTGNIPGVDPYDGVQNGAGASAATVNVTSITPSQNGDLFFVASIDQSFIPVAQSPFTQLADTSRLPSIEIASGYYSQVAAASQGVTVTGTGTPKIAAALAAFKGIPIVPTHATLILMGDE